MEKTFFDYAIENPDKLNNKTIVELANNLFISKATISRACQKLGFSGFKEFKYSMLSIANKDEYHEYYKKSRSDYYELINNRLKKTIKMIDDTEFNLVLEMINNADTIEVFSVGGSYSSGLELSRKLSRLNFDINTRSDWDELDIVSKRLKKNDLAIFISQTGETEMLVDYQNQIIENQCPCIAIVGTKNSTIGNNSNVVIHCPTLLNYIGEADLSSRVPFIFIIDLITWELSGNSSN